MYNYLVIRILNRWLRYVPQKRSETRKNELIHIVNLNNTADIEKQFN
jgi:hypothetical protein